VTQLLSLKLLLLEAKVTCPFDSGGFLATALQAPAINLNHSYI
jgi:hypothetical protein